MVQFDDFRFAPIGGIGGGMDVAWAHDLTIYDAAYLHLGITHRLPLVTLDAELRRAAESHARP